MFTLWLGEQNCASGVGVRVKILFEEEFMQTADWPYEVLTIILIWALFKSLRVHVILLIWQTVIIELAVIFDPLKMVQFNTPPCDAAPEAEMQPSADGVTNKNYF